MHCPDLSPKFLTYLEDYALRIGKDADRIIEEAVSQAILRHESADRSHQYDALLMSDREQRQLTALLTGFDGLSTETRLGEFLENLPDQNWTYQVARFGEWWFLVVSKNPQELPEPLELRSVETSQAYVWLFGYSKQVRLWSAQDRFLVVF